MTVNGYRLDIDGYFGSLIFAAEANQGLLLDIFIIKLLGFILGGIIGILAGSKQRHLNISQES